MPDIAIFAVANRTGSTLLQRIFNANPDTLMWGENGRALARFLGIRTAALEFSREQAKVRDRYFGEVRPMNVDISCMAPQEAIVNAASVAAVKVFFDQMYSGPWKRVGFKEVAHSPAAVDLFKEAFPEATLVFLARHPVAAWRSHPPQWQVDLDSFIRSWKNNVIGYSQRGRLLWFEDMIMDRDTQDYICSLAEITREQLDEVLRAKVNSTAAASTRTDEEFERIMEECGELIPAHIMDKPPRAEPPSPEPSSLSETPVKE